ncbi:MAG: hypothetical protein OXF48_03655 [Bacteroidetes bacterium]|nr:hypothetical protein [Bacteroidota bacterium]
MYDLLGKRVRVHLYTHEGIAIGVVSGRVADVAAKVEVSPGMQKDLALVVDIEVSGDSSEVYTNSNGMENEGWFAVQDLEILEDEGIPGWFPN